MQTIDLAQFEELVNSHEYFILDKKLKSLHPFLSMLDQKTCFEITDPEESKTMAVFEKALDFFLKAQITRDSKIIVIGGGATSDLGGFVAASLLRGLSWEVIPSTLLAMIDASIGGKVGINSQYGKNLIGSFHYPDQVYFYFDFLSTLEEKEIRSGRGELLKYKYLKPQIAHMKSEQEIILECAKYKTEITTKDFKEKGERKLLNLGHTFGHAIEKCTNKPHGECVAWGLKVIIDLYSPDLSLVIKEQMDQYKINEFGERISFDQFFEYLKRDKKRNKKGEIELIIPKKNIGATIEPRSIELIQNDLKSYEHYKDFFK